MSIRNLLFVAFLVLNTGCTSDLFLDNNGNIPDNEKISQIKLGQDKAEVRDILGSPSAVTALSDDHWIYMSSTIKRVAFMKPNEVNRQLLALTFENGKLVKIDERSLEDGNKINIDTDSTPTASHEQGFFRKYFGGVGSYMPFGGNSKDEGL